MLNQDYTAKSPDLEDVILTKVGRILDELYIYLKLPEKSIVARSAGL